MFLYKNRYKYATTCEIDIIIRFLTQLKLGGGLQEEHL